MSPELSLWVVGPALQELRPYLLFLSAASPPRPDEEADEAVAWTGWGHFRASLCPRPPRLASQGHHFVRSAFLPHSCPRSSQAHP